MIGLLAAALAGYGTYLIYTAVALSWTGLRPRPVSGRARRSPNDWLAQAGLAEVRVREFLATVVVLFILGAIVAYLLFGGALAAAIAGLFSASFPVAAYRARRQRRIATAREAWPRLLEELRLLTGSLGRSIPQALFDVGRRAPAELAGAFQAAEREWLLTTDFDRTLAVLKQRLADPTADTVCETLAVANEVGGGDLNVRLAELIEDRIIDLQGRKEAESRQSGVRFSRLFVLLVPLGMAGAGLSIGTGRAAYETAGGQLAVAVGLLSLVVCWVWSGRLLRLPEEPRIFADRPTTAAPPDPISPAPGSLR